MCEKPDDIPNYDGAYIKHKKGNHWMLNRRVELWKKLSTMLIKKIIVI